MGSTDVARTDQPARTLRPGDRVTRGQVLARMWSPELGEKKSRFLAAFSRLMCDQEALAALQSRDMPAKDLAEAERHCQFDQVTLDRAESALRDLQFLDADLDLLRASALRLHEGNMDYQRAAHWAEWELRSPGDGVVVESRLAAGIAVECGSVLCVISTGDVLEARGSATGRDESLLVTASPIR